MRLAVLLVLPDLVSGTAEPGVDMSPTQVAVESPKPDANKSASSRTEAEQALQDFLQMLEQEAWLGIDMLGKETDLLVGSS